MRRLAALTLVLACAGALSPATAAPDEAMLPVVVRDGDSLWRVADEVLVSRSAWPEVARLNRLRDADRLRPGQVLMVPVRLLRSDAVAARIVSVQGDVRVDGTPAGTGAVLQRGQTLTTAADASAVIELYDGSRLQVQPGSSTTLDRSERLAARPDEEGLFAGTMRLLRGSLEVLATKLRRAKPLEVQSPTAVIGVRGTEYRVHHGEGLGTRTEVLEGRVRAEASAQPGAGTEVAAGYGAALGRDAVAPLLQPLPPAPAVDAFPAVFERVVTQLPLDPSRAWRLQVAVDDRFDRIVRDRRFAAGEPVRVTDLPDGAWVLRVRQVEPSGIEGLDARHRFEMAARPEPPALLAPRADGRAGAGQVPFRWAENLEAQRYRLQVAADEGFTTLLHDDAQVAGGGSEVALTTPGVVYWRIASLRAPAPGLRTQGPWSAVQRLTLVGAPAAASGGLSEDGRSLSLRWNGRAQDRQRVELARDAAFTQGVVRDEIDGSEWTLPRPDQPGTYYFRYRSVESDGFVTPSSETLKLEIPRDWRNSWLLGLPLLLLL